MACSPPWRGARSSPAPPDGAAGGSSSRATAGAVRPARARPGRAAGRADGLQRVLIAPSSPLGIESLPEAEALLDDFHAGILELGAPFELWAGLVLADPAPQRVDALLDARRRRPLPARGRARRARGHRAPRAGARAPRRPRRAAVRPSRAGRRNARLVPGADRLRRRDVGRLARLGAVGAPAHPQLRVVFAMLAGLAPLHAERLAARGGPSDAVHDRADVLRHLLLRSARDRRDAARRRRRPPALWLRPAGDRAGRARGARRRRRARHRRHQPGALRMNELDGSALESPVRDLAADPGGLGAPRAPLARPAPLRGAAPRRRRRGLADLLDGRPRHRLP